MTDRHRGAADPVTVPAFDPAGPTLPRAWAAAPNPGVHGPGQAPIAQRRSGPPVDPPGAGAGSAPATAVSPVPHSQPAGHTPAPAASPVPQGPPSLHTPAAGPAVRPADPPEPTVPRARGSRLPARWRITAWIMLTTLLLLAVVLVTARSLLMRDVSTRANADLAQEADEFRTFAAQGVDPTTSQPFTSVRRLLEVYLQRQSPVDGEVMAGVVDGVQLDVVRGNLPAAVANDPTLFPGLAMLPSTAAVTESAAGELRWGRVDIDSADGRGSFVIAAFTRGGHVAVDRTMRTVAAVSLTGLVLTTGIAYLVAGRILLPVRTVREVAAEIGETDLSGRVPVEGRDDVAALAATFNAMLDRLEHAYTTQRRFIDDAGHELRTPITVVRGHLELLPDDPAERRRSLALVDSELSRMGRIVSDLLMLAKSDQPDFVVQRPVDAAQTVLDIESKVQALGDRRWHLMEVAEGVAWIDAQRVTQAMLQLAANAVAHTEPGTTVQLGSRFADADGVPVISFYLSDQGPGVRPEDAPLIFERFRRGAPNEHRAGAGLGLAIVRAIADAHHGSAWVRSVPGDGATFGLDLPVEPPHENRREMR
ncbi:ATP-binding protein [Nocardia sp. NPDC057353]|uniref:sensor histidine kinase n=1 Tax=Nocardia sp. NPDC057353 TaxID=3346104 RepID=UPI00362FDC38